MIHVENILKFYEKTSFLAIYLVTPLDRVIKSITINKRLTFKCHTLLKTSEQSNHILGKYHGGYLTPR